METVLGGGCIDTAIYICPKCSQYMLKKFHSFCNVSTNRLTKATVAPSCESCLNDPKECRHKHFTATIEKKIPYCGFWLSKTYNPFREVETIPGKTKDKWVISDEVLDHAAELRRSGTMWAEVAVAVNEKFTLTLFPAQINSAVIRKYPELRKRHYKTKADDERIADPPEDQVLAMKGVTNWVQPKWAQTVGAQTVEIQRKGEAPESIPVVKNDDALEQLQEAMHTRTVGCVHFPKYCNAPFKVMDAASLNVARQMISLMAKELGIE